MSTKDDKPPTMEELIEAYSLMSEEALQDEIDYFSTHFFAILEANECNYLKAIFEDYGKSLVVASQIDEENVH